MTDPTFPVLARALDAAGVEVDVWHVRPERMAQLEAADAACAAQRIALQKLRAFCAEVLGMHAHVLQDPVRNNAGRGLAALAEAAKEVLAATPMDDAGIALLSELRELRALGCPGCCPACLESTGGQCAKHRETECTCYELTGGHQPGCPQHPRGRTT